MASGYIHFVLPSLLEKLYILEDSLGIVSGQPRKEGPVKTKWRLLLIKLYFLVSVSVVVLVSFQALHKSSLILGVVAGCKGNSRLTILSTSPIFPFPFLSGETDAVVLVVTVCCHCSAAMAHYMG